MCLSFRVYGAVEQPVVKVAGSVLASFGGVVAIMIGVCLLGALSQNDIY